MSIQAAACRLSLPPDPGLRIILCHMARRSRSGTERRPRSLARRILVRLLQGIALILIASILGTLALRWIPLPTSAVMAERRLDAWWNHRPYRLDYRWVPWIRISPHAALAVIAAEDQNFTTHHGFDFESIQKALDAHERGRRLRGASTISQQVAKNVFLWSGRSFVRKALEAYFTAVIELTWSKRRILEVYLNVAELGEIISISIGEQKGKGEEARRHVREDSGQAAGCRAGNGIERAGRPATRCLPRRRVSPRRLAREAGIPRPGGGLGRQLGMDLGSRKAHIPERSAIFQEKSNAKARAHRAPEDHPALPGSGNAPRFLPSPALLADINTEEQAAPRNARIQQP